MYRWQSLRWRLWGGTLLSAHIVLGLVATILTLSVSAHPPFLGDDDGFYKDVAFVAAMFTAALTFLNAREDGKRYSAAGRYLQDWIGRYDIDDSYVFNDIARSRSRGEEIIRTGRIPSTEQLPGGAYDVVERAPWVNHEECAS
jgi:hypothetical protein